MLAITPLNASLLAATFALVLCVVIWVLLRRGGQSNAKYRAEDPAVLAVIDTVDRNSEMGMDDGELLQRLEAANRRFPDNPLVLTWLGRCLRNLAVENAKRHSENGVELFRAQACRNGARGVKMLDRAIELLNTRYQDWPVQMLGNAYCGCGQLYALQSHMCPGLTPAQREVFHSRSIGYLVAAFLVDPRDLEFSGELLASLLMANEAMPGYLDDLLALLASDRTPVEIKNKLAEVKQCVDPVLKRGGRTRKDRRRLLMSFFVLLGTPTDQQGWSSRLKALRSVVSATELVGGAQELVNLLRQSNPAAAEQLASQLAAIANSTPKKKPRNDEVVRDKSKGTLHPGVQEAIQLNKKARYEEAVKLLDTILTNESANVEAFVERGISRLFLRQFAKAHSDLAKAIEIGKSDRRRNCKHISEAFARLVGIFREAIGNVVKSRKGDSSVYVSEECRQHFSAVLTCIALSLVYDGDNEVARILDDPSVFKLARLHGYDLEEMAKFMTVARHVTAFGKIAPHVVPAAIRERFLAEAVPPCPIQHLE